MAELYDDRPSDRAVPSPSPETLAALRAQWTPDIARDVLRYAKQRARMVRTTGRPCPPLAEYARELVHDAHADTFSGELRWDPQQCSLAVHLRAAIKLRTWREIHKAARYVSLEMPAVAEVGEPEIELDPVDPRDRFSSSPNAAGPAVVFPALIARVCDALRLEAGADREFLSLLRAWERGFTERTEIMKLTGFDKATYDRVRKRILYVAARLSLDLRELVRHYLGSF
jgi:hypothetical protein